jgi:hypothetical protein
MSKLFFIRVLLMTLLCTALLAGTLTYAQEEPASETAAETDAEFPTGGVTTLVLLIGLGAVAGVGFVWMSRGSFRQDSN